ncbi:hypothetical protein [Mangrovibacterium marinum]|uniref:Uncharacterized protein n=1 Tax=Mangrovibacterium marinum TaxID=1639118 RepID=A0A2T5BYN6_9BACT|nr:hypothetical protein [Mangrovibacterium marinum]PTN07335.1 hypothetical protein C8N47_11948 [Mangrovibacterium marinum]
MDHPEWKKQQPEGEKERKSGGAALGIIFIVVGLYWIAKETGLGAYLPGWEFFRDTLYEIYHFLSTKLGDYLLPILLVITGLLLVSGRRKVGGLVVLIALLFLLPDLAIPGVLMVVFFPVVLIVIGVVLLKSLF